MCLPKALLLARIVIITLLKEAESSRVAEQDSTGTFANQGRKSCSADAWPNSKEDMLTNACCFADAPSWLAGLRAQHCLRYWVM